MALSESKVVQVINAYLNFCNEFKRTGEITDKNFNRIRVIKSCIGGQEEDVRLTWGDLFDEVYNLLENPEIKLRLDEESKEIEKLRLQKTAEKKSNQKLIQSIVSSSKQTNIRQSTINSDNIQKQKKRIIKKINGKYIEEKSIRNASESGSSVSNDQKRKKKKQKNKNNTFTPEQLHKSLQEIRKNFWASVAQAKENEEARKIIKPDKKIIKPLEQRPPICTFDDSSIFGDIMDEKRAEGKGYSSSK